MSWVYRVASLYGNNEYFNTSKEVDKCKPGGEQPESVTRVDAAAECNRLERYIEETDRRFDHIRLLLEEFRDACPAEVIHGTDVGRRVNQLLADNPLPPATSADRDGQRSYGV